MKISINWLKDYVETDLGAEQIADILSDLGFPCEGMEYPEGDTVIDVEVTSNRGDCLGHIGLAREVAAATGGEALISADDSPVKLYVIPTNEEVRIAHDTYQVALEQSDAGAK